MTKEAPDEFAVVERKPLSVPDIANLRPPQPGAVGPTESDGRKDPRKAIFRSTSEQRVRFDTASRGEEVLLRRANANRADKNIRNKIDQETRSMVDANDSVVESVMFWKESDQRVPATVVDPSAESKRLRRNMDLGLPSTEGETPTMGYGARGGDGLFDGLF